MEIDWNIINQSINNSFFKNGLSFFIWVLENFTGELAIIIFGWLGANQILKAYRNSEEGRKMEAEAAKIWWERKQVGIQYNDYKILKEYYNHYTQALYKLADSSPDKRTRRSICNCFCIKNDRMNEIINNLGESEELLESWEKFTSAKSEFIDFYTDNKTPIRNMHAKEYSVLRASWMQFYIKASPRSYTMEELENILSMGIRKIDFEKDGRPINPNHKKGGHKQEHRQQPLF